MPLRRHLRLVGVHLFELARLPSIEISQASLDDATLLRELLPRYPIVVHLASTTTPGSSVRSPVREAEENILPTLRLLETLAEFEPIRLLRSPCVPP